ncbi:MAG: hypothetical protein KF803_08715 [Cyclobacteriaceae bacterium]|nr:hypothetical protein [Cyclobacteriaceae bacterium]
MKVENGDYQRIAEIFNRRHSGRITVTRSYVRLVVQGLVPVDGEKANEVKIIADKYFDVKTTLEKELLSSTEVAA